ncbi:nose resistant to fluoxetine protein 6-like [Culex pipiens pallens]|uniref:nose resistant to fluoxetine protein 6-like n=1 Tax=Culex pipiens pallens TaxID=42434 RepID=UPI0019546ECE|nr:nose resistant to fluoxetine protein 6-like [Culex pipiens pallens]
MAPSSVLIVLVGLVSLSLSSEIVPPLYRYDDYDRCRQGNDHTTTGVYCFVKVVFEEDRDPFDSPRIISDFRRNLLDWGVCVEECQRELKDVSLEDRQRLFEPKFPINFTYIFPADFWDHYLDPFNARYDELINVCVNNRLERNYTLDRHAYSEIEYCTSKDELGSARRTPHWLMSTFYAIMLIIFIPMVGSNVLEWLGFDRIKDHIIVSSFSVKRNWDRLTQQSKSELYREFGYLEGLRVFMNLWVMATHIIMFVGYMPMGNPEFAENLMKNPLMIDVSTASIVSVQIFLAIGGLLVTNAVLMYVDQKHEFDFNLIRGSFIHRLIRIAPLDYFFILWSIVVPDLLGIQVGPVGYKMITQEQARCRKMWWTNVLFLNNLPAFSGERCNIQSWYLAADLQLFLVAMLLLATCCKYPKHASSVLWTSVVIAVAIPIGNIHMYELESSVPAMLSNLQFFFMYQPWFNHIYAPGYSNFNCYLAGVVVGYLYHQHKHRKLNFVDSLLFKVLKMARIPMLLLAFVPTFIFYQYEIPRSSWLTLIHSVLYRNAAVIVASVTFVDCFQKPQGVVRRFLASKALTSLGKLTYSLYLVHVPVFRLISNWFSPMPEVEFWFVVWILPLLCSFILVAVIAYFCIEQPCGLLLKHFFFKRL